MEQDNKLVWDKDNIQWRRSEARYASQGIYFEEKEDNIVLVKQSQFKGHKILNQKELVSRGRSLYPDKQYKIHPCTFTLQVEDITPEWIQEQMTLYGIKPKDLAKQLAITPSTVSIAINGTRPIAPQTKALFYYYFQTKRLGYEMEGTSEEEIMEELAEALAIVKARKAQEAEQAEE